MKTLKILLIDDHKMIRDGIKSMLESQENKYKFIIDEAESGEDGIDKAKKNPDIIIMDYQLPKISGAEAAGLILKKKPRAKILALSNYNEYMYIDKMVKMGVKGFILKNIGPEELIKAIEAILNGGVYYSSDVAVKMMSFDSNFSQSPKIKSSHELEGLLSQREIEVLQFLMDGYTSESISKRLNISKRTVDSHRQKIMIKFDVKHMAGLVQCAMQYFKTAAKAETK